MSALAQGVCSVKGLTLDEILAAWSDAKNAADANTDYFDLVIKRVSVANYTGKKQNATVTEPGVLGTLTVNGELLGDVLENDALKVAAGKYRGRMRYVSEKNFVQGPLQQMAEQGDFLLEIMGVKGKSNILVHSGTKPWHSEGCILAGAAVKKTVNGKTTVHISSDSTLSKLRRKFYGTDTPKSCPDKRITITINDI